MSDAKTGKRQAQDSIIEIPKKDLCLDENLGFLHIQIFATYLQSQISPGLGKFPPPIIPDMELL